MDLADLIVKTHPGVLGGKHEEKRPLRPLSALPVKRYVFINRDSHPDADIYVAIHEAKDLPADVPDYQVPLSTIPMSSTTLSAATRISPGWKARSFSKVRSIRSFRRVCLYSHRCGARV
jgi:hypothetical protein